MNTIRNLIRTSPGWFLCTVIVIWLVFIGHFTKLESGLLAIALGSLGILIDRIRNARGTRGGR